MVIFSCLNRPKACKLLMNQMEMKDEMFSAVASRNSSYGILRRHTERKTEKQTERSARESKRHKLNFIA